jgi:hypothetical protein
VLSNIRELPPGRVNYVFRSREQVRRLLATSHRAAEFAPMGEGS